jgi:hypothetical protein
MVCSPPAGIAVIPGQARRMNRVQLQARNAARSITDPSQPAESAFALGVAALIKTIFGFVWLGWGFSVSTAFTDFSSGSLLPATRWLFFYAVFLGLLGLSVHAVRRGKNAMKALSNSPNEFRYRFGRPFKVISFFEMTGCGIVVLLAILFHRLDLLAAGISLVVGLHFLPLARLFRFSLNYVVGIAIVLCDLLSVILLRAESITLAVGVATGTVLWLAAMYSIFRSREFLRQAAV